MSKRRKITITETEYNAIIRAWASWYCNDYETADSDRIEHGTPIPTKIRQTNQALERIQNKWRATEQ